MTCPKLSRRNHVAYTTRKFLKLPILAPVMIVECYTAIALCVYYIAYPSQKFPTYQIQFTILLKFQHN